MVKLNHIILFLVVQLLAISPVNLLNIPYQEEVAKIVVYVKPSLNFSSFALLIHDDQVIAPLSKNTYYIIEHPPGKITLKTKGIVGRNYTEDKEYSITLVAGKTYYLEALKEYQYLMTSMHLVRRTSDKAKGDIEKMKAEYINLVNP